MADYEVLYKQMLVIEKDLRDKLTQSQKLLKSIGKSLENGNLKNWTRDLGIMRSVLKEQEALIQAMQAQVDDFGVRDYVENGDFAEQMLACCEQLGVDVKGSFPTFEMFPFKVKVDVENLDLYLDRKRVQCLRPLAFVQEVKKNRDKLLRASFDARAFVKALVAAYDLVLLKQNQGRTTKLEAPDLYLKDLYDMLTPMSRQKREYDQQSFAFDLSRLYASDLRTTEDGRQFQFGPSRNVRRAIRILDQEGQEHFLSTIRFF
ncbi:MAG: hypothetical protein ACOX5W_11705 [Bacillota bacterium]|jgi:hypothetical protein